MTRTPIPFGQGKGQLDAMRAVSKDFKAWKPAPETMQVIRAVETIFPTFNVLTGVGGFPVGRICLLHGPSNEGKSALMLGLGRSFLEKGHFFGLVDAERTTPPEWARTMMRSVFEHPGFVVLPHSTYEEVVKGVRQFCRTIAAHREAGKLDPNTTGLIVVDSIRKLFPKKALDNLLKESTSTDDSKTKRKNTRFDKKKAKGVDGMDGMTGMIKANLNAAWMDELCPLMADTRCSILLVGRETEQEPDNYDDVDFHLTGGSALKFEPSLRFRAQRHRFIPHPDEDKKHLHIGERMCLKLYKTKLAFKEEKVPRAYLNLSNGGVVKPGFWRARDVLELAEERGVIEKNGAWYKWGDTPLGQGFDKALAWLEANGPSCMEIEKRAVASALEAVKR